MFLFPHMTNQTANLKFCGGRTSYVRRGCQKKDQLPVRIHDEEAHQHGNIHEQECKGKLIMKLTAGGKKKP
jgi:hypothetical protein